MERGRVQSAGGNAQEKDHTPAEQDTARGNGCVGLRKSADGENAREADHGRTGPYSWIIRAGGRVRRFVASAIKETSLPLAVAIWAGVTHIQDFFTAPMYFIDALQLQQTISYLNWPFVIPFYGTIVIGIVPFLEVQDRIVTAARRLLDNLPADGEKKGNDEDIEKIRWSRSPDDARNDAYRNHEAAIAMMRRL